MSACCIDMLVGCIGLLLGFIAIGLPFRLANGIKVEQGAEEG